MGLKYVALSTWPANEVGHAYFCGCSLGSQAGGCNIPGIGRGGAKGCKYMPNDPFYKTPAWRKLRAEILKQDKYECQLCKKRGYYRRANTVHHIKPIEKYPELALSKYYIDENGKKQRNLISVCRECHEREHEYRQNEKPEPLTPERW